MLPKKVLIREVGPREGFQIHKEVIPTEQKLRLIEALVATGVSEIEVASFVRPDRVPQMADAEDLIASLPTESQTAFKGLYLNQKGYERAEATGGLQNESWMYAAVSDSFLRKNSNNTFQDLIESVPSWAKLFSKHKKPLYGLMISTAFGSHEDGAISGQHVSDKVDSLVKAFAQEEMQPSELCLADTVGLASPETVRTLVGSLQEKYSDIRLSLHLHDTRGLAVANAYAGLMMGVDIFEASVAGMGGCPFTEGAAGNMATEEFVFLCHELGIETGLSLEKYREAALLAEEILSQKLPGKFAHAKPIE